MSNSGHATTTSDLHDAREVALHALSNMPTPESWVNLVVQLRQMAKSQTPKFQNALPSESWKYSLSAFQCLVKFLQAQDVFKERPHDLAPFMHLYDALAHLEQGGIPKLFPDSRKGKRPPEKPTKEVLKALAAKAVDELMSDGMLLDEATAKVAGSCGNLTGGRRVNANTVKNWRATLKSGAGAGAPKGGAALFAYQKPLPASFGATSRERADQLMLTLWESTH